MKSIQSTIKLLKNILRDDNCDRMNHSVIVGYLGELLVKSKLEKELNKKGVQIIHKGNQSGYDLAIDGRSIEIDVKTSTLKDEVKDFPPYWGWALKHANKTRPISCSHFVCIALNSNFKPRSFYVIKAKHVKYFSSGFAQFRNVERSFIIMPRENERKISTSNKIAKVRKALAISKKLLNRGVAVQVNQNGNLSRKLGLKI